MSEKIDTPKKFAINERVFVQEKETYDLLKGTVTIPLTIKSKFYTIKLLDDSSLHDVHPSNMYGENSVLLTGKPSNSCGFFQPDWLKQNQKVSLLNDEVHK